MFIYEKNKLNKETGQVEQSLNVTFEGNKPVETPDVVITKDGVTGIKSDSKAYVGFFNTSYYTLSSASIDVETPIADFGQKIGDYAIMPFTKSIGFNIANVSYGNVQLVFLTYNESVNALSYDGIGINETGSSLEVTEIGEYIYDAENGIIHTPSKDYSLSDLYGWSGKIIGFGIR